MATYVAYCKFCDEEEDYVRSIHEGPNPVPACPRGGIVGHGPADRQLHIQTSTLVFGDFEQGDDDFSLRYRNNGSDQAAKPNRTQNKTNVNQIFRKYGKGGMPLELRKDIDSTKLTSRPLPVSRFSDGTVRGGQHVEAPAALQGSTPILRTKDLK